MSHNLVVREGDVIICSYCGLRNSVDLPINCAAKTMEIELQSKCANDIRAKELQSENDIRAKELQSANDIRAKELKSENDIRTLELQLKYKQLWSNFYYNLTLLIACLAAFCIVVYLLSILTVEGKNKYELIEKNIDKFLKKHVNPKITWFLAPLAASGVIRILKDSVHIFNIFHP
jgi:hypothetical protein